MCREKAFRHVRFSLGIIYLHSWSSQIRSDRIASVIEARGSRAGILRAYSCFAPLYGAWSALFEQRAITCGLTLASVRNGERVLEVAVGTAVVFVKLREQAGGQGSVIGVDIAPGMIRAARRRVPDAVLVRADARALPFIDCTFDLVWSSYFLDLIPTPELPLLLLEFRRVLRPSGRMVLVNLSKKGEDKTWWERIYQRTPSRLVPYLYGSCRPIQAAPLVCDAGFIQVERALVSEGLDSEVIVARKPL